jgi:hypothetical protein
MAQVAMRAPHRDMRGVTVEGVPYEVSDQGVVMGHAAHVNALRSLGFHPVSDETPDVPDIVSLSEDDWKEFKAFKESQAAVGATPAKDTPSKDDTKLEKAEKFEHAAKPTPSHASQPPTQRR